jgi:hypothetical protein
MIEIRTEHPSEMYQSTSWVLEEALSFRGKARSREIEASVESTKFKELPTLRGCECRVRIAQV